jgi:hypothetical protein
LCPDIPDPESPDSPGTLSRISFQSDFCGSQVFVWVLLSTSSKSKPADQSPFW